MLITGHRRENFGDGFLQICQALQELAARYPALHFVYPVHLNPNVRGTVSQILTGVPGVIPAEMCYLGWQDSLQHLARLVEAEAPPAE